MAEFGETLGKPDKGSRTKSDNARQQAEQNLELVDSEAWPRNENGKPLAKITATAAELVPTGQYANVSVGPCQITMFVDPDNTEPLPKSTLENLANALNSLTEVVEADVVAVQRNLVQENLQGD